MARGGWPHERSFPRCAGATAPPRCSRCSRRAAAEAGMCRRPPQQRSRRQVCRSCLQSCRSPPCPACRAARRGIPTTLSMCPIGEKASPHQSTSRWCEIHDPAGGGWPERDEVSPRFLAGGRQGFDLCGSHQEPRPDKSSVPPFGDFLGWRARWGCTACGVGILAPHPHPGLPPLGGEGAPHCAAFGGSGECRPLLGAHAIRRTGPGSPS